jgi:hypothetical protein
VEVTLTLGSFNHSQCFIFKFNPLLAMTGFGLCRLFNNDDFAISAAGCEVSGLECSQFSGSAPGWIRTTAFSILSRTPHSAGSQARVFIVT